MVRSTASPPPLRSLASRAAAALALGLAPLLGACDDGGGAEPPAEPEPAAEARAGSFGPPEREVRDLVTAVTPPPVDATQGARSDWYRRRRETLERLRAAPPEVADAALAAYHERSGALSEVRGALLDVAAHGRPEEVRPILVELVRTYGDDLGLRKEAAAILARTSPETAVEVLEPIVLETRHDVTYPPADELLEAWTEAAVAIGRDPSEVLATVATDIRQDPAARHFATKQLGRRYSDVGRQALESVLVESLGNNLLRRYAAQSLLEILPREEFCALVQRVFEAEADLHMQQFLADVLETRCL